MKKIFSLFAAALMSVSLFAGWPATVPTIQDLSDAGYNITSARVIALYFEEEVCNDIVWYGSYNEWATDPTSMLKFETLEGFEGWYVVELNDESETVQGKPVQLKKDGSFSLDFQSGDADAWENMFQPYTKSATITNGESGEANCTWPNLAAYIYMVHYFKNNNTPCFPTYNYTINAYLPEFCEAIDDYNSADSVRVMGGFDNWTNGVQMIKTFDEDFNIYYTATINDVEEGTEFKLRFGSNWDVQVQKDGKDLANETTSTNETITLRYDGEGYGFAACAGPAEGDTPTSYLAPIYNTANDPTSGIKQWDTLTCDDYKVLTAASEQITLGTAGSTTWYVVNGADVQLTNGAVCNGDVRLILADDAKLTATGADSKAGVHVSGEDNSLTIYGQTAQSGQLIANGGEWGAGIGGEDGNYDHSVANGSNITINGGMIEAIGGFKGAGIGAGYRGNGSYITINRGTVVATGGDYGAGIGGGYGYHDSSVGNGSDIIINGGMVTANGGEQAAGIGGGYDGNGSNITINGGTVVANGRAWGAGIGGGHDGDGSNITINGGTVTANGDDGGAGIGGGNDGDGSNITINGGTVIAIGGYKGAGIGAGMDAFGSDIFVATSMLVKAGETENPTEVITNTGADLASSLKGKRYVIIESKPIPVAYIDENGAEQTASAYVVADASAQVTLGTVGETSWYVVNGADVQLTKGAVCNGDVRLILADGAKLTATGWYDEEEYDGYAGIQVSGEGNSFSVYGQAAQTGQLIAQGSKDCAGIGSEKGECVYNITINGGNITATGGGSGAGIGSGHKTHCYNITINGGTVEANGGNGAAGIGGGNCGNVSNIVINGGTVTANGGTGCAGIGAGNNGVASDIYVSTIFQVKADGNNPPTTVITNTGADLASSLAGKQYVTIEKTPITFIVPVIDQVNKQAVMLSHYPNGVSEYVDYIDYRWYRNGELVAEGVDNFREPSALNGCYHIEVPVDATKSQWIPSNEICFQNGVFVGIDAIDEYNFSFSVVPNPVTKGSMMTVSTQLSEQQLQGASLMVYDLKGHIFTTMPMSQQSVTLTAEQTPGIYVIQITTRTGEKYIQKVVVR